VPHHSLEVKCRRCQHHVDPIALYSFAIQRGKFYFKKPSIYFIREYIKGVILIHSEFKIRKLLGTFVGFFPGNHSSKFAGVSV
jgi:hypothetical protein